jgi:hypothetical protein
MRMTPSCRPRRGARCRAALALAAVLVLAACVGGPEPVPGTETTTLDVNEDIRAALTLGETGSRPALPGESLPPVTVDPLSGR